MKLITSQITMEENPHLESMQENILLLNSQLQT